MKLELNGVSLDFSHLPEDQQQATVDAVQSGWDAAISGLKGKNADLIQQAKDLKEQVRSATDGNTAEASIRLSDAQEEINGLKNQIQIAEHNVKQTTAKLEAAEKSALEMGAKHDTLVKTTALTEQLTEAGVLDAHLLPAARALLMSEVSLGDDGTPLMGDKAMSEFIAEWKESDQGKAFVSAGDNTGANAQNNGSGHGHAGPNPFAPSTRNVTEQMRIQAENPELAKQLQSEAGSTGPSAPAVATQQVA